MIPSVLMNMDFAASEAGDVISSTQALEESEIYYRPRYGFHYGYKEIVWKFF